MSPAVGRPPEPDEASSHRLWAAWSQRVEGESTDLLAPADYLAMHRETGVPLRGIWNLTQRWAQYGNLTDPTEDSQTRMGGDA